jgi:hypothetical protein
MKKKYFKELFLQVSTQYIHKGIMSGRRQVVDSVFVKANTSMHSCWKKKFYRMVKTGQLNLKKRMMKASIQIITRIILQSVQGRE